MAEEEAQPQEEQPQDAQPQEHDWQPQALEPQPPSFGQQLGLLYKAWTLDCVITIAHAVSLDFSDRPELYQHVADEVAESLTRLQGDYGFRADLPGPDVRLRIVKPVFGESDGYGSGNDSSPFQSYRLPVLAAAADFSENAQPTAFPMLRERVRSSIVPFKTHMVDLQGSSLTQTEARIGNVFNASQAILKDPDVAAVFGISAHIDPAWPLNSTDPQGAKLIEKVTTQLLSEIPYGLISRESFVHIQRIGEKGRQSIEIIVDSPTEDSDFDLDPLITQLYAWGSDLRLVGGARAQPRPAPYQPAMAVATNGATAPTTAATLNPMSHLVR
jgi:hypothetical protein